LIGNDVGQNLEMNRIFGASQPSGNRCISRRWDRW